MTGPFGEKPTADPLPPQNPGECDLCYCDRVGVDPTGADWAVLRGGRVVFPAHTFRDGCVHVDMSFVDLPLDAIIPAPPSPAGRCLLCGQESCATVHMTADGHDFTEFRAIAHHMPMSQAVLDDNPPLGYDFDPNTFTFRAEVPRPLTPEETARRDARHLARVAALRRVVTAFRATGGLPYTLLRLHVPDKYGMDCAGCAGSKYGAESGGNAWPCPTLDAVAEHAGIDLTGL